MTCPTDSIGPDVPHTEWCDPAECATALPGWHHSTPLSFPDDDATALDQRFSVQIGQIHIGSRSAGIQGFPWIDMTVHASQVDDTDTEEDYVIILSPKRALALGHLLTAAGRAAMGQQPVA